jgi:NAD(P)-dependent dehydrogenase (short-subunit alcohol dehydrogenase family)
MSEPSKIFITGASTGLGHAAALLFAQRGWRVIATMRNPSASGGLDSTPGIEVLPLDVTSSDQIDEVAKRALAAGPIDVVFNNAGYGLAGPIEAITDAQLAQQIDTNLLGVIRVTRAFVPHFRDRRSGMFINTTSIGGLMTFPFFSMYHATKWAVEGFSESLAFELAPFGVRVKTIAPGHIKTDFSGRSMVLSPHPAYAEAIGKVFSAFSDPARAQSGSTAAQIAEVVFEAATDASPRLRYLAGSDAQATYAQRLAVGDEAFRAAIMQRFLGSSL